MRERDLAAFVRERLVPLAASVLREAYAAFLAGADIDVRTKEDGSPASRADRETEARLREVIAATYPDHGIVGEEWGIERADAPYVWVLDPLDGTKEFLAREGKWGSLIALMARGRPVWGAILDPVEDKMWTPEAGAEPWGTRPLGEAVIATTAPQGMFAGTRYEAGANLLWERCGAVRERLNALGFAYAAEGLVDAAVENKLKLYDIAALLPPLWARGVVCRTLEGLDYRDVVFEGADAGARYSLVASRDTALVEAITACWKEAV